MPTELNNDDRFEVSLRFIPLMVTSEFTQLLIGEKLSVYPTIRWFERVPLKAEALGGDAV